MFYKENKNASFPKFRVCLGFEEMVPRLLVIRSVSLRRFQNFFDHPNRLETRRDMLENRSIFSRRALPRTPLEAELRYLHSASCVLECRLYCVVGLSIHI